MNGDDRRDKTPESRALDAIVDEARARLDSRERDWARIETRLLARVEHEKPAIARDASAHPARSRAMLALAAALAVAAAAAIVVRRDHEATLLETAPTVAEPPTAGALRSLHGDGEVRIASIVAAPGHVLRSGDALEVEGPRAVFERTRNKITWLLEGDRGALGRARVKSAGEPLVIALDDGAIEAQVASVASGEAFAVDIATERTLVRVAVHGTHLRVARSGTRVVVDLNEGIVSIGTPPRVGSTYGALVTAPAHVELDALDVTGTLRVDHAPGAVRAPIPLGGHEPVPPPKETSAAGAAHGAAAGAHTAGTAKAIPTHLTEASQPPPKGTKPPPPPARDMIAAAVRECAASKSRPTEVRVTVNSVLRLRVGAGGEVVSAQFDPPLLPEIQSCVTPTIYRSKLDETGAVSIPIEFSY